MKQEIENSPQNNSQQSGIYDPLTGVYSRATLDKRLREGLEYCRQYNEPLSLLILDLDHFKSVNDAFGHSRGDEVLIEFARRLGTLVRTTDLLFRYGGEEFVLLFSETSRENARGMAERILDTIKSIPFPGDPPISLSLSIGVSCFPEDARDPEALFEKADERLYEAKRQGRGRVISESPGSSSIRPFAEVSRLAEREHALDALHRFLNSLREQRRGLLAVDGLRGSGRTRFLAETTKSARLWGYEIISISGDPALKGTPYAVISASVQHWTELPSLASVSKWVFMQAFHALLEERSQNGLIVIVDDLAEVDVQSLELLEQMYHSKILVFGIIYSTTPDQPNQIMPLNPSTTSLSLLHEAPQEELLNETIELGPLTQDGVHIWLRSLLRWEPPLAFITWLYQEVGGLPGTVYRGLDILVEWGILQQSPVGWTLTQDYTWVPLGERLGVTRQNTPHNLPVELTELVGRENELQEIHSLVKCGHLITLLGPGGIGKSRLALQIAVENLPFFRHGVYLVPLAAVSLPEFVPSTIAAALQFSFYSREDPRIQLVNYLRDKEMLLVLDNFEHLLPAAGILSEILQHAPGVKMLVTSYERLNLHGEWVFEVRELEYPSVQPDEVPQYYSAVQLFLQSAQRVDASFELNAEEEPHITKICQLVEGLPLAIELAAAWVRVLPCQEIAREIEKNFDFLTTAWRDIPERHRSLRAVFEYSWSFLTEQEKDVLKKLAVFRGDFRRDAAEKVTGATLAVLPSLVDKSLLRRTAIGRYEMHELLRQYAEEKLSDDGADAEITRSLHAEYFADFLYQRRQALKEGQHSQVLRAIDSEIENVRLAWRWIIENANEVLIEQCVESLFWFYETRSWFLEGAETFSRAIKELRKTLERADHINEVVYKVMARWGIFCLRLGQYRRAKELLSNGLEGLRALSDSGEIAFCQTGLANIANEQGEYVEAKRLYENALSIYSQINDEFGMAEALRNLGTVAYMTGRFDDAQQYLHEVLKLAQDAQIRHLEANSLKDLGNVCWYQGNGKEAKGYYEQALLIYREIGSRQGEGRVLNNLGNVFWSQGDYDKASAYLERALRNHREIGDRRGEGQALNNLGNVASSQHDYHKATGYFEDALDIYSELGARWNQGTTLYNLGNISLHECGYAKARTHYTSALEVCREISDRQGECMVLAGMGLLSHYLDDNDSACEYSQMALTIGRELNDLGLQGAAQTYLGHAFVGLKKYDQARFAYQQALTIQNDLEQFNIATESQAGLAYVSLMENDLDEALARVEEILAYVQASRTGRQPNRPLRVYLTCHRVLDAHQDSRANDVLSTAYNILQSRANQIDDEEMRDEFLQNVDMHQEILDAYTQMQALPTFIEEPIFSATEVSLPAGHVAAV